MFQLDDATIRPLLKADIITAWGANVEFEDNPAYLPGSAADLPRVFVELDDVTPQAAQGSAGIRQASVPHIYQITGQFTFPASGTIETAKITLFNQLAAVLSANIRYYGYRRLPGFPTCQFATAMESEAREPIFTLTIRFGVEVLTGQ